MEKEILMSFHCLTNLKIILKSKQTIYYRCLKGKIRYELYVFYILYYLKTLQLVGCEFIKNIMFYILSHILLHICT